VCVCVAALQKQIKEGHGQLEELWESRRARLELCLQLCIFEQQSLEVSSQLERWAEELKHAELSAELAKAEQLLVMHVDSSQHMQAAVFEMLQRGQELAQVRINSCSLLSATI
jgi:hypothetical protein